MGEAIAKFRPNVIGGFFIIAGFALLGKVVGLDPEAIMEIGEAMVMVLLAVVNLDRAS